MCRKWLLPRFVGCVVGLTLLSTSALVSMPHKARAEGSAQLGQISANGNNGLMANAVLFVDVLEGEDTLNIAARGQGTVDVTVTPVNSDGSLGAAALHTLTNGNGLLNTGTVPASLPNGGNVPLRVAVQAGRYRVVFGEAVEPFDLSVTTGNVAYSPGDVPAGGGRLSATDWRFFGDLPGAGEIPMDADFYVRATVGDDYEYVWQLQFAGLLGGQMCLTANDLGLPGEFARSSQPYAALSGIEGFDPGDRFSLCEELSEYDIYVNPPNNRKPEPPAPTLEEFELGSCGAIIEGTGGVFSFDTDLEGTYVIVIDVNRDDVFDVKLGDIGINGNAQVGNNVVAWDGRDSDGNVLAKGAGYAARLFVRLGEFHFTGSDIEALDPGITVNRVPPNGNATQTRLYWDDEALAGNAFNGALIPPNPVWSTPNGVLTPHSWRGAQVQGTTYNGPGENSFIDTWVFGAEQTEDLAFDILGSDDDLDGDGLINGRECAIGSLVDNVDSDNDGVWDGQEELSSNPSDPPTDSDGDGIPDALDEDDDGDGIPTRSENPDPNNDEDVEDAQDTDGDGIPDYLDDDDDGDGVLTIDEGADSSNLPDSQDSDGDGIPDYLDDDDDGDGVPTADELGDANDNGVPDYLEQPTDSDGDGVPDHIECPVSDECPDTDDDGIDDIDDTDDDGDGIPTADEDVDGDGDPRNDDTDGDGVPNYLDDDDDGDGIPTLTEVRDGEEFGNDVDDDGAPNWLDTDSDGDGVLDGTEAAGNGDANDNGTPDYLEPDFAAVDTDGDGIIDMVECPDATNCPDTDGDGDEDVNDPDDDNDGVPTAIEAPGGNRIDTDGDGVPDYLDEDDDGDGISTKFESPDPDGDGDVSDARDTDDDGTPDYLDEDDDGDELLTKDEDADPNGDGDPEDAKDSDGDGIPDYLDPTTDDPNDPLDSDGDGVPDAEECPDPDDCPDSDGDGTLDDEDTDDDGDGVPTAREDLDGDGDPTNDDSDGDGIPNYLDPDDDNDGVFTKFEDVDGDGNPANDDTDGDDIPDYLDSDDDGDRIPTKDEAADPNGDGNPEDARDTDGDGTPDYLDSDDDGDGIRTRDEVGDPKNPRDSDKDGIPDYLDDSDDRERDESPDAPDVAVLQGGGIGCSMNGVGSGTHHTGVGLFALALGMMLFTRRRNQAAAVVAAATAGWVMPGVADAQQSAPGFALNRYNPSERGSDWFAGESLDLRGHGRLAAGLVFDWAHKPLVSYDANGEEVASVVENQLYGHVGMAVNLWDRLRLAASFPVLFYQNGSPVIYGGERYETRNGAEVGDLRFGADLRLFGEYGDAATLAIGSQLTLPTGDPSAYSGDGEIRLLPRAALAGDLAIVAYSLQAGLDYRSLRVDYADTPFGTEMRFGATIGLRLADKALLIGPELWGSTVISDHGDGFFSEKSTPFEGIFGAHYLGSEWRFGAGIGPGFTRGLGSPALRVLASLEWFPGIEEPVHTRAESPLDTDADGIIDAEDACVEVPGVASPDKSKHGCPLPRDTDADGIVDTEDACVTEPGVAHVNKEKHGCPPDRDEDGVLDRDDACVDQAGQRSDDPKKNGCPLPKDSDGDGIIDPEDACPDKAGAASDDPQKHGCPRAEVSGERVVILDRIEFDTGEAKIRAESALILDAVRAVLAENPRIKKLRVEGHTDNRGARPMNVALSRKRAAAVVQWLVEHGIDQTRLTSQGFGPDKPVDSNDTDAGRQNNRRVEFHIVETGTE